MHIEPKQMRMLRIEFEEICELVKRHRSDWPACFSCNEKEELWIFARWKRTPFDERVSVRNLVPKLDKVAHYLREFRPDGGRFFLDELGAYWKEEELTPVQFLKWETTKVDLARIKDRVFSDDGVGVSSLDGSELEKGNHQGDSAVDPFRALREFSLRR